MFTNSISSLLAAQPSALRCRAAAFKPAFTSSALNSRTHHRLNAQPDGQEPSRPNRVEQAEALQQKFFASGSDAGASPQPPPQRPTPPAQPLQSSPQRPIAKPQPPSAQQQQASQQQPLQPTQQQQQQQGGPSPPQQQQQPPQQQSVSGSTAAPAPSGQPVAAMSSQLPPPPVASSKIKRRRNANKGSAPKPATPAAEAAPSNSAVSALNVVNPVLLGRKARKTVSDLWERLSSLSAPTRSVLLDDIDAVDPYREDADTVQAQNTTVLVVGATGRVGRILIRKLLLRGYTVRALVRRREGKRQVVISEEDEVDGIPAAVEVIEGDVGVMNDCQEATKGVDKVIYCAAARSTFTGDLLRVDDRGVGNIAKALQDEHYRLSKRQDKPAANRAKREVADFSKQWHQARWEITYVGNPAEERAARTAGGGMGASAMAARAAAAASRGDNLAVAEINDENMLVFEGRMAQRGAMAEVGASIEPLLPRGEQRLLRTEGLVMRLRGDGQAYVCILRNADGQRYGARFITRNGYMMLRLPFTAFRPESPNHPPLAPEKLVHMAIRYENRITQQAMAAKAARAARDEASGSSQEVTGEECKFLLEIDWIKALPEGVEPDVVLVSCAGQPRPGVEEADMDKLVEYKRRGEDLLRLSGLGYTIIRPGTLVEEPGGYRALVFDQGGRISDSISAADVADVCLRAMHETSARNKTFDVCYEFDAEAGRSVSSGSDDEQMGGYELIAHVPGNRNNYLRAAVGNLQKNT